MGTTTDKHTPLSLLLAQHLLFAVALAMVWYVCYPHTLLHLEETDYWTDGPDTCHLLYLWPREWAEIAASYLMQFYKYRLAAVLIHVAMLLLVLLSCDVVVWRLSRRRRLLWLSFVPAAAVALLLQTATATLVESLRWAVLAVVLAVVVAVLTCRWRRAVRSSSRRTFATVAVRWLPFVITAVLVVLLTTDKTRRQTELTNRIEHLTAQEQWADVLALTYDRRYALSDNDMSYSLLALSQQGQLAERLFTYPVRGLENVYSPTENFRFNAFFCHALGLPNEAIRYAFEEGQYMPAGFAFGTIRRMTDWLIEKGDDPQLADYYLRLLDHTTCHRRYITDRRMRMLQSPDRVAQQAPEFVGSPSFLHEAAVVLDREPANTVARDYLLCGLLLLGRTDAFCQLFDQLYVQMDDKPLPRHYREALAAMRAKHPHVASTHQLGDDVVQAYQDFLRLMRQPHTGRQQAADKYRETYWAYLLRLENAVRRPSPDGLTGATHIIGPEFGN